MQPDIGELNSWEELCITRVGPFFYCLEKRLSLKERNRWPSSNRCKDTCISLHVNTNGKGMECSILSKSISRLGYFVLLRQQGKKKKTSWLKSAIRRLKWPCVIILLVLVGLNWDIFNIRISENWNYSRMYSGLCNLFSCFYWHCWNFSGVVTQRGFFKWLLAFIITREFQSLQTQG